ncbi:MAG: hypothetical protein HOQ22_04075 [Nocardioidaceae bacterium]|nr:hypothetical protein [Nocardioidaceae bacterium]NUS50203.1 hypothetical protein [Nocardioidaceae bacterium]
MLGDLPGAPALQGAVVHERPQARQSVTELQHVGDQPEAGRVRHVERRGELLDRVDGDLRRPLPRQWYVVTQQVGVVPGRRRDVTDDGVLVAEVGDVRQQVGLRPVGGATAGHDHVERVCRRCFHEDILPGSTDRFPLSTREICAG